MSTTDFLQFFKQGNVILYLENPAGDQQSIRNLDEDVISMRSPLLVAALDAGANGQQTVTLHVPSFEAGVALVRYLYLGSYVIEDEDEFNKLQPELRIHAEMLHIANTVSSTELAHIAIGNFNACLERAMGFATSPHDLVSTIVFLYDYAEDCKVMLDSVLHYCVACFTTQKLGQSAEIVRLAENHNSFHSDISRVNAKRGFENVEIPKMAGPVRRLGNVDTDLASLFTVPAIDIEESSANPQANAISAAGSAFTDDMAQETSDSEQVTLAIRTKEQAAATDALEAATPETAPINPTGNLDFSFKFPMREEQPEKMLEDGFCTEPGTPTGSDKSFDFCDLEPDRSGQQAEGNDSASESDWSLV